MYSFITCPAMQAVNSPKSNLGLLRRRMGLRHHHLAPVRTDLHPQSGHQIPDRGLPDLGALLLHQPLPDPAGGVPLFPRHLTILHQPSPNKINMLARHRRLPMRNLSGRRPRIRQRLTHRSPVHPMTPRQGPNGHALIPRITSDTFKLLHSRSLLQQPPLLRSP
jgi:hypothetical protein